MKSEKNIVDFLTKVKFQFLSNFGDLLNFYDLISIHIGKINILMGRDFIYKHFKWFIVFL